jgi:FtsZ-binding cell division protein ZapB
MRVLKPGGKAVLTTDVKGGDNTANGSKDRRDDEPFSWRQLHSLLAPYAQMIEGGLDQIKIVAGLQDDTIEHFWISHQGPTSTWQGNRGYVVLGIVLVKSRSDLVTKRSPAVGSDTEGPAIPRGPHSQRGYADTSDVLLKSQIRKTIEFQHALEQKEKVIQELHAEAERRREALEEIDRTLKRERAEWAKERKALSGTPLSFWKAFRHRLSKCPETQE